MRRLATTLALPLAAAAVALAEARAGEAPSRLGTVAMPDAQGLLEATGWQHGTWQGIAPATWRPLPGGGVAVEGMGQGSFVWRSVGGAAGCLGWRWRVAEGPPPMDLTRRGTDRALSIAIGFGGFPPGATAFQRTRHAMAQTAAGKPLPRSVLIYVWGGTGQQAGFFPSPYAPGLAKLRILRPADAPRGLWAEERVDLAADWRAAFGGEPPPLTEIAIGTDVDDSRSRISGAVTALGPVACR